MPFTPSHIAAVLPLARAPLVASALVIGSMSPDIPYYAPMPFGAKVTHSAVGVVSIDILLGLVVFLVWHGLLARPAAACAPAAIRGRIPAQAFQDVRTRLSAPRPLLLVLLSLSVGAATHVVWDAFTHSGRWGTELVPWLAAQHGPLVGHAWAQYSSGLLGAFVVALWLAHWWRSTAAAPSVSGLRPAIAAGAWLTVLSAGAVGAALGSARLLTSPAGTDLHRVLFLAATRGMALAAFVGVLLALTWHAGKGRQPADETGDTVDVQGRGR